MTVCAAIAIYPNLPLWVDVAGLPTTIATITTASVVNYLATG